MCYCESYTFVQSGIKEVVMCNECGRQYTMYQIEMSPTQKLVDLK